MCVERIAKLFFLFAPHCDWSGNLAPPSQQSKCRTETNYELSTCFFFILQAVCLVLVWVFISFSLLFLALTAGCDHLVLFSQHSIKKRYMYLGQSLDVIAGWKREGVEASYTRLAFFDMYMCSFIENEM